MNRTTIVASWRSSALQSLSENAFVSRAFSWSHRALFSYSPSLPAASAMSFSSRLSPWGIARGAVRFINSLAANQSRRPTAFRNRTCWSVKAGERTNRRKKRRDDSARSLTFLRYHFHIITASILFLTPRRNRFWILLLGLKSCATAGDTNHYFYSKRSREIRFKFSIFNCPIKKSGWTALKDASRHLVANARSGALLRKFSSWMITGFKNWTGHPTNCGLFLIRHIPLCNTMGLYSGWSHEYLQPQRVFYFVYQQIWFILVLEKVLCNTSSFAFQYDFLFVYCLIRKSPCSAYKEPQSLPRGSSYNSHITGMHLERNHRLCLPKWRVSTSNKRISTTEWFGADFQPTRCGISGFQILFRFPIFSDQHLHHRKRSAHLRRRVRIQRAPLRWQGYFSVE